MVEHVIRNDGVVGSSPISGTSAPIGGAGVFGLETKFACNFVDDRRVHGSAVCAFWVCADGIVAFFF
jgi:hypothetical protein